MSVIYEVQTPTWTLDTTRHNNTANKKYIGYRDRYIFKRFKLGIKI
jgi:hypothetical protein